MPPSSVRFSRREWLPLAIGAMGAPMAWVDSTGLKGMVVGQPLGAAEGMKILAQGGNAMDAAVTAAFVACVVAPASCGVGGYGGHMVVYRPGQPVKVIDFNTVAPCRLKPDLFEGDPSRMQTGWLSVGVPGTLAGLQKGLELWGTKTLGQLLEPAIRLARDGFPLGAALAKTIQGSAEAFRMDPGSKDLFLGTGKARVEGETFKQKDLSLLLERFAKKGNVEEFYRGEIADLVAKAFADGGGIVNKKDLSDFEAKVVDPIRLDWNGATIYTAPLTGGGMTMIQVASALKTMGWDKKDFEDPQKMLLRLEVLRLAWLDRLSHYGDPKKSEVPVERLLSSEHAGESASKAEDAVRAGRCLAGKSDGRPAGGTIHISAVDRSGMMVALTLTHGDAFGAKVTIPGLGVILGHGVSRFDPRPSHPNGPAPGKKPLHNMCPTLILRGDQPWVSLGATGGRRIVNTVQDLVIRLVGERHDLTTAGKLPRVHTEGSNQIQLARGWPANLKKSMTGFGYQVAEGASASASAVEFDPLKKGFSVLLS